MTLASLQAISPLLVLGSGAVAIMLAISITRSLAVTYWLTLISLLGAAAASALALESDTVQLTPLLRNDTFSAFFSAVFCSAGAATAILSRAYLSSREGQNEEYFLLLLLSTMGASTLAYATHLISLLLGLELMGVALYALIAYPDRGEQPLEAAIKYLVLSGAASATLLFGFALLYAALGALDYPTIGERLLADNSQHSTLLLAGGAMIFAGAAFKLSAVPFHMWTPDVYEGAPAPVTGFLASVSKAAVFVALLRWFLDSNLYLYISVLDGISLLAVASILVGNLLALLQDNVKRLLAYSSISHMGYLLVVLVACGMSNTPALAVEAGSFYVVAYIVTTLAAFTLLGIISRDSGDNDLAQRSDLTGLFWRSPVLAFLFSLSLLSLAGIPLTAGFIGKFYIINAAIEAGLWNLLVIVVIGSAIAIFYYLRLIFTMSQPADGATTMPSAAGTRWLIATLVLLILYLGILPQSLMSFLQTIL
jgi:NADH-quinone oxidoreductase subunit N